MLVHRVSEAICKYTSLQPRDTVIVGTSGGADSTALLYILKSCTLNLRLIAAYIDHGLRPDETRAEYHFIQQLAKKLEIESVICEIEVKEYQQKHKCSLEAAARTLRYAAIEDIRLQHNAEAIAVAHTADDQAEEFFIRLIRGTGLKGLCGMNYTHGKVIRPLLAEPKSALLEYLSKQQSSFCYDSSNDDRSFLRNRIRQDLLPDLEKDYNPSIRNTILQTASILQQDESLLNEQNESLFAQLCTITSSEDQESLPELIEFNRDTFVLEHPALQRRLIEKICWKMKSRPTFRKIEQLQRLITGNSIGSKLHFAQGLRVQINNKVVVFSYPAGKHHYRGDAVKTEFIEQVIPDFGVYRFPEFGRQLTVERTQSITVNTPGTTTLYADPGKITFPLTLRPARPGEKMKPLGAPGRKKIARILSDLKIPADERGHHPLLISDGETVAIIGVKIDDKFKVEGDSKEILALRWETIDKTT